MTPRALSRRRFLLWPAAAVGGGALAACVVERADRTVRPPRDPGTSAAAGGGHPARLCTRIGAAAGGEQRVGTVPLGVEADKDALVHVPAAYRPDVPLPLVVTLHGAGGTAAGGLGALLGRAEEANLLLLAPQSRGRTWDAVGGAYGPDVAVIDQALAATTSRYAIDPTRVAVAGFSDGASYALGLGLANGDVFGSIVAFSPGFEPPAPRVGRPRIFVSHGVADDVLPIDRCSRRIVPRLRDDGYDVRYEEFPGGHEIPPGISAAAGEWLAAGR